MTFEHLSGKQPKEWPSLVEPTCLIRVDANGCVQPATDRELLCPNALVLPPDQKSLLVAEYFSHRVSSYERRSDGSLGTRKTVVEIPHSYPDGMCIDASGALWIACCGTCEFIRISENGQILEAIPASDGFMAVGVMLGGEDGRTLFMLEAQSVEGLKIKWNGKDKAQLLRCTHLGALKAAVFDRC
eukprot:gnl/TRDRNA2_/TRDRNA2_155680_c1_seq5.p1 gnl/TRDRNA2_/TRDRNA2_155680_c1~~gnl/TRDRNA2_/TRDRNA2_155680_c1_seq5.p1  ORF type:complete len:186 (-),score=19.45 gnl/TRDRNA2_/TRDRNA2_155680_c1_seq5:52-609(-)